jgi:hypothetical protein
MKAHLIYHGNEIGSREDCSIFYEVPEVFLDENMANARVTELEAGEDDYVHRVIVDVTE